MLPQLTDLCRGILRRPKSPTTNRQTKRRRRGESGGFPKWSKADGRTRQQTSGLTSDPGERDCKEHELEPKAFFCSHSAQRVVNGKSEDQQKGDTGSGHDTESVEHGIDGVRNRVIGSLLDLSFRDFIGVGLILLSQQAETEIFLGVLRTWL